MSSLDLVADEAKIKSAAACNENASLSPRVALRKDLSSVMASTAMLKRSWSSDSLSSSRAKACVCAPTTHPGSFRCRLHRQTALRRSNDAPLSPTPPASILREATTRSES
eukprot:42111_1